MRPVILSQTDPKDLRFLEAVKRVTAALNMLTHTPDAYHLKDGKNFEPSCHHVARIVAREVPGLQVVDGEFMGGYEHSWLAIPDSQFIIDPYPWVAHPAPLLLSLEEQSPWRKAYSDEKRPSAVDEPDFEREVEIIYDRFCGARTFLSMP